MNLLPKSHEEFSHKDYWESFFKKRGNKAFEWYGEYPELCGNLHKYIKTKDVVLVVGCGNSSLSSDLYDVGYNKITNIDISQVVIRQMLNLHEKQRPDLKYLQMDVFEMSFDNESFTVVLDKGTLDALMPDDKPETIEKIKQYFNEIERVLKVGGRYICITLLQKHILDLMLNYFPSNNWMFRVVRCFEAEKKSDDGDSSLPVFMVICTKFKCLKQMILEVNMSVEDKMQRVENTKEVVTLISGVQQAAFVCAGLRKSNIADQNDVSFDLYKHGESVPRYTIHVVDLPHDPKHLQYAAFIVPQGREIEWLFSTNKGRKHLARITKYNRLAVIATHRGQEYGSLESVQDELHEAVCQVAPSGVSGKILFLSIGSDVGSRITRCEGNSATTGGYIVEDVEVSYNNKFRRLLYLSTQSVIQSEAKLKAIKTRNGQIKEVVDHTFLTCRHHTYMSVAVQWATGSRSSPTIAVIGLGGGGLCMFLRKFLPQIHITAVDIDKDMLQVATNWFGLKLDEKLHVEILDGIEFLRKTAQNGKKFDAILFDIDSKDTSIGMSCPPKQFLESSVLENVHKCLNKKGLFILNLVIRDEALRPSILSDLKTKFSTTAAYKLEDDLNEIVICATEKVQQNNLTAKAKEACDKIDVFFKSNRGQQDELFEVKHFLENLHIDATC